MCLYEPYEIFVYKIGRNLADARKHMLGIITTRNYASKSTHILLYNTNIMKILYRITVTFQAVDDAKTQKLTVIAN